MRPSEGRNRVSNIITPESGKCGSIVPLDMEKAGKKPLTSYPLSVAIRMAATPFQSVVDTVL